MIKLRFWIFALIVVALVVANLFFTSRRSYEDARTQAQVALEQAGQRLEQWERALSVEAVTAAQAAATTPAVVQPLGRAAAAGRAPVGTEAAAAGQAVAGIAADAEGLSEPQFVLLATESGVARIVGEGPAEVAEELPEWAVLASALDGSPAASMVALEDGSLMRVAAAPVQVESGRAAVLLGWPVDAAHAQLLSDELGLEVTFLLNGEVVAGSGPPIQRAGLVEPARRAPARTVFGWGRDADLVLVGLTQPLTGVAPVQGFGWEMTVAGVDGAAAVLSLDAAGPMDRLEGYQVIQLAVIVGLLLLAFLWSFYIAQAAYGPARRMHRRLQGPASGELKTRLEPRRYKGPFRKLAQTMNGVLDQVARRSPGVAEALMSRPEEDVESVLGAAPRASEPEPEAEGGFPFGEPSEPAPPRETEPMAEAQSDEPEAERRPTAPPVAEAAPPTPPPPSQRAFDPFAEPESPAPAPGPAARPDFFSDETRAVSPDELAAAREESAPAPRTPTDPFAAAMAEGGEGGTYEDEENPDATVVAKVPDALLQATARAPAQPEDPDAAHFKQVFREFLDLRQRLGESAEGVTWEKFLAKLQKNRDAIKEKHGARSVRFQVYEKNGKAALKATPIR